MQLSTSSLVDAAFEVRQCRKYVVEGCRLREVHVPHRLVITPQRRQTRFWWDEAKCSRLRLAVVRPRTAKELSLPRYNPVPQFMKVDCLRCGWMAGQCRRVRVVAGELVRHRLLRSEERRVGEECRSR